MTFRSSTRTLGAVGIALVVILLFKPSFTHPAVSASSGDKDHASHDAPTGLTKSQGHPQDHRVPTVDGAKYPQLISDERALSVFLLMAAGPEDRANRSYVTAAFRTGSSDTLSPAAVTAIVQTANAYQDYIRGLAGSRPSEAIRARSDALLQSRRLIATALGPNGDARLMALLNQRIKPGVRVFAKPGGEMAK